MQKQGRGKEPKKGSYVLLIFLEEPLEVKVRGAAHELEVGHYAYCGSAMGPGGLASRIARHRRSDKKVHWHVDQVTTRAPVLEACVTDLMNECDLAERLLGQPEVSVPLPGFGSSDCARCESHFLKLEDDSAFHSLGLASAGG